MSPTLGVGPRRARSAAMSSSPTRRGLTSIAPRHAAIRLGGPKSDVRHATRRSLYRARLRHELRLESIIARPNVVPSGPSRQVADAVPVRYVVGQRAKRAIGAAPHIGAIAARLGLLIGAARHRELSTKTGSRGTPMT